MRIFRGRRRQPSPSSSRPPEPESRLLDENKIAQEQLEETGIGAYTLLLLVGVGGINLIESLEMGVVSPLHKALSVAFNLSDPQRSSLPLCTLLGSAIGVFLAGPFCDLFGRKTVLISASLTITAGMLLTAIAPLWFSPTVVLLLRGLSGFGGAIGGPAGTVLVVESCPANEATRVLFGVQLLSTVGYLIEALFVQIFMPHFGEDSSDKWRSFCWATAALSVLFLPAVLLLQESPIFLAVRGDLDGSEEAIAAMARMNGRRPPKPRVRSLRYASEVKRWEVCGVLRDWACAMWAGACAHWQLLVLLCLLDSARTFFVGGSAYLWNDFFTLADGGRMLPTTMNNIAALAPIIGVLLGERLVWVGVRSMTFSCSMIALAGLIALTYPHVRASTSAMLSCVFLVKLTYGPLNTLIALLKAESFPTAIRASAFCFITIVTKGPGAISQGLNEALRGGPTSEDWKERELRVYIILLCVAVALCGVLATLVPGSQPTTEIDAVKSPGITDRCWPRTYGTLDQIKEEPEAEAEADPGARPPASGG